jgi:CheY-like chemotaxis protein/tRNA A-37 threonylcarbamoyl transferase component Bud32
MANPSAEAESGTGRVLVVDDEDLYRRALVRQIRARGHTVTEACDGATAVELAAREEFDLVVSDIHMPDMDGVELLRRLHESDADLPVVLISGIPDLDAAIRAIGFGAFDYLTKPVDDQKLSTSIARALHEHRKRLDTKRELKEYRSGERGRPLRSSLGPGESWSGALLAGRYRVGRLLGSGGMGVVYEAVREDLAHMRVAIKVLHPELSARADLLARFRREAETVAAIDHSNIVKILDFQAAEGEPVFLVMERLDGASLGQTLSSEGRFSANRAAFVTSQVLSALAAAHRAQVIHRDLKPDNVFLTTIAGLRDIVKLLDFGVAKLLDAKIEQKLTETGMVLGTPPYMAPEHARGARVDARSDVYAAGCVLYESLTGVPPFVADNYNALIFAVLDSRPRPLQELLPDVDANLAAIVAKAMSREPAQRFQSADAMAAALAPWAAPARESLSPGPDSSALAFAPTIISQRATSGAGAPRKRRKRG